MANPILESLLAPYRAAVAGQEPDYANDPLYAALAPQGPSGAGGNQTPAGNLSGLQEMAAKLAAKKYGWTGDQWNALQELVSRESSWNPNADNPNSTAYGLFQFLQSTRDNYGLGLNADPKQQILAGLRYVSDRYGSPTAALSFHDQKGWY